MAAIANKIIIGDDIDNPILTFENAKIREVTSETAVSMIGDELFIDQFTPITEYEVWVPRIIKPTDARAIVGTDGKIFCSRKNYDLRLLPYGTKITYYTDDMPSGEFFCKKVERVGKTQYKINAVSAIGLMDKQYHLGDLYRGTMFSEVIYDILGDEYDYLIDGVVATQRVFGWLPYDTKRRNLHQLLVAYGVNIIKGEDGKMFFTFLEEAEAAPISSSRVIAGGSISYDDPASMIEVTEHGFFYSADVEEEVLFDNTGGDTVINSLVTFDKPIYADSIHVEIPEGETYAYMTIHSCGTNYAYVSGIGILKGKPYVHTERIIREENENAQAEKVVKIEEATLISVINSEQVVSRLAEYYFHATTVKEDIILETEKAGNKYLIEDPFKEEVMGFITKMSMRTSATRRATCDLIQNYDPVGFGASYTNSEVIPLGQNVIANWEIPDSVFENEKPTIRVVLIGHGFQGQKGADGENGKKTENPQSDGGAGGVGGIGGAGGRVLIVTLDPTAVPLDSQNKRVITVKNSGNDSLLTAAGTTYSSANGASRPYGYYDPFTDVIYAPRGQRGINGGAGGQSDKNTHTSATGSQATTGEDVVYHGDTYKGGNPGKFVMVYGRKLDTDSPSSGPMGWLHVNLHVYFGAGGGGGAAAGVNGNDAYPQKSSLTDREADDHFWHIGEGAAGADAGPADTTVPIYGAGGNGGHGGGGGGGGANLESWNYVYNALIYEQAQAGGKGGKGSEGGIGNYGCAIIYY